MANETIEILRISSDVASVLYAAVCEGCSTTSVTGP